MTGTRLDTEVRRAGIQLAQPASQKFIHDGVQWSVRLSSKIRHSLG
jgi:hypothetical protein